MNKGFSTSRITIQPWNRHGLRAFQHSVSRSSRSSAVKQLSNTELLEIIRQDKEDITSTAIVETKSGGFDSHDHDGPPEAALSLANHIPRLPHSLLTDQNLVAARIRHRVVKPLPCGIRSPFQLKLQKNPYGIYALVCGTKH